MFIQSFLSASLNPSQFKGQVLFKTSNLRSFFCPPLPAPWNDNVPRLVHHHTPLQSQDKHHYTLCTATPRVKVRSTVYFWLQISAVLWNLMLRHPSLSSAATLENMLVVKHIKHVHCHFCIYRAHFFPSFLFSWQVSSNGQLQIPLFTIALQLQAAFASQQPTCTSHLATAPHCALESTSAFQCKAGVCQESQTMTKFGFLKVWQFAVATFSPQLLGRHRQHW